MTWVSLGYWRGSVNRVTIARQRPHGSLLFVRSWRMPPSRSPRSSSNGSLFLIGEETVDRLSGQQILDGMAGFLNVFNLMEPIAELGRKRLWGPDLLAPSQLTMISPWVMGGEPVVRATRIPTAALHALRHDRGLDTSRIVALYPELGAEQVDDAIALEDRLRRAA